MFSALKLMIVGMKLSFIMILLIDFHVKSRSPSSVQIDSKASLTMSGGWASERTSTKCCFFMLLTAMEWRGCYMLIHHKHTFQLEQSNLFSIIKFKHNAQWYFIIILCRVHESDSAITIIIMKHVILNKL
jgi:hypothetical protein